MEKEINKLREAIQRFDNLIGTIHSEVETKQKLASQKENEYQKLLIASVDDPESVSNSDLDMAKKESEDAADAARRSEEVSKARIQELERAKAAKVTELFSEIRQAHAEKIESLRKHIDQEFRTIRKYRIKQILAACQANKFRKEASKFEQQLRSIVGLVGIKPTDLRLPRGSKHQSP